MLQFITHSNEKYDYLTSAIEALEGGCRWIQLRMKNIPEQTVIATALQLKEHCRKHNAKLILDDHVQATFETGADGVHLGKNDMPPSEARKILGNGYIIGGTANTFDDIERLIKEGVDYIGLGPFRYTETKKNLSPILGIDGYKKILTACKEKGYTVPIVAIGGITKNDIPEIMSTGVTGIALSGSILRAKSPQVETQSIINLINKYNNE